MTKSSAEGGPGPSTAKARAVKTATIPSYGVEFFEYRRRLFLAGLPLPPTPTARTDMPDSYTAQLPLPAALRPRPKTVDPGSHVGRLETLLLEEGVEETVEGWKVIESVHVHLTNGKRLAKPLRLGLVIKILKAGWIIDGTWPMDSKTGRAIPPPGSPIGGKDLELNAEPPATGT